MRGSRGGRFGGRGRDKRGQDSGFLDEVLSIRFHTKVTKGGRNLSCAALVVVGDGKGKVGLGYGKARGVPMAIEKATKEARGQMVQVNLVGDTVAHEAIGRYGAARVLLKPAGPGTGVKAGGTVRKVLQVVGVHNVLSKIFGNTNPVNIAKATMKALSEMRSVDEVQKLRGVPVQLFHPQAGKTAQPAEEPTEAAPEPEPEKE